ncbi:Uncharacterized protein Fot_35038 [Forsythia ovata]|uniref:Uncharacterized protein n=1 Tax=Forsythia ovata TaxID=205694 RepID=A0ABD1SKE0_9LAMI
MPHHLRFLLSSTMPPPPPVESDSRKYCEQAAGTTSSWKSGTIFMEAYNSSIRKGLVIVDPETGEVLPRLDSSKLQFKAKSEKLKCNQEEDQMSGSSKMHKSSSSVKLVELWNFQAVKVMYLMIKWKELKEMQ